MGVRDFGLAFVALRSHGRAMSTVIAFIGCGEACGAFRTALDPRLQTRGYDVVPGRSDTTTLGHGVAGAGIVLSVVTADQALAAAKEAASCIERGAIYLDCNSVAPDTKRAAAAVLAAADARYVDVAVMAPVVPGALAVPLLLSGEDAPAGAVALRSIGFTDASVLPGGVGRASTVKMLRSVMVKGIEALTAEMMLGADAAGLRDEVLASLGDGWHERARYNLERMETHGARRSAEMAEAAKTLIALGVAPLLTEGTIVRQAQAARVAPVELAV